MRAVSVVAAALLVGAAVVAVVSTPDPRAQEVPNVPYPSKSWDEAMDTLATQAGYFLWSADELSDKLTTDDEKVYGSAVLHAVAAEEVCNSTSTRDRLLMRVAAERWETIEAYTPHEGVRKLLTRHLFERELATATAFNQGCKMAQMMADDPGEVRAAYCAAIEVMIEDWKDLPPVDASSPAGPSQP